MANVIIEGGNLQPKSSGSCVLGAIIGDYLGSVYEFNNKKSKDVDLFAVGSRFTDDTILTIAVFSALDMYKSVGVEYPDLIENYLISEILRLTTIYPNAGYGGRFKKWISGRDFSPYNSKGNGAAMRISPVAYFADHMGQVIDYSRYVTGITHNTEDGYNAAECISRMIYGALSGKTKDDLKVIADEYYDLNFTLDSIRDTYKFSELCEDSVPQAIVAFLESNSYEDAIRNAISIGGDSDTIACIAGGIAGAYYGIPDNFIDYIKHVLKTNYIFLYEIIEELFI